MRLAIIEDESKVRILIRGMLTEYHPYVEILGDASSVSDGLDLIKEKKPDVILLDVELGDGTGFDLLSQLLDNSLHVIFITAFDHYAVRALRADAVDYLEKPLNPEEFTAALLKARRLIADKSEKALPDPHTQTLLEKIKGKIAIPTRNGLVYLESDQVVYAKANGSYAELYLESPQNKLVISRNLSEMYPVLEKLGFLRIHRSYLINSVKIQELSRAEGGYVVLSNGHRVPISKQFKEEVIQRIKALTTIL